MSKLPSNRRDFLEATSTAAFFALTAGSPSGSAGGSPKAVDGVTIASKHDFVLTSPTREPLLGMLLGNGDLGASAWADGETLVFTWARTTFGIVDITRVTIVR